MEKIRVGSSIYDIESQLLQLTEKYILDNEGYKLDSNLLKTGLFGWLLESLGLLSVNSLFYKSAIDAERFPNTATLPKNIYNFATIYQSDTGFANPAQMKAVILIREPDIVKIKVLNLSDFIIDKSTVFEIDNVTYMLPATIKVIGASARYMIEDSNILKTATFELKNAENLYLKSYETLINEVKFLAIECDLLQVSKNIQEYRVLTDDLSQNISYYINVSKQLSNFRVFYQDTELSQKIELKKYLSVTPINLTDEDAPYCNYNLIDSKQLQINFPALAGSFRPSLNSIITVETYETIGGAGNFSYSGEISVIFQDINYQKIVSIGRALTPSQNGRNEDGLLDIKKKYLRKLTRSETLITQEDLTNYITDVFDSTFPKSQVKIVKVQDDVIRRLYRLFILMRDNEGNIIPTNTIDLELSDSDMTSEFLNSNTYPYSHLIPAGSYILYGFGRYRVYKEGVNTFTGLDDSEDPSSITYYLGNTNYIVYRTPYMIALRKLPFNKVSLIRTSINEFMTTRVIEVNNGIPSNFIINRFLIQRNDMLDNNSNIYNLSMVLKTNYKEPKLVYAVIKDSISGDYLGYYNMNTESGAESNDQFFILPITAANELDENGDYILKGAYSLTYNEASNIFSYTTATNDIAVREKLDVEIHVVTATTKSMLYRVEGIEPINLFSILDRTNYAFSYSNDFTGAVSIAGIPVFRSEYVSRPENYSYILDYFYTMEKNVFSALNRIENSNDFDVKYYNTYGPSTMYNTRNVNLNIKLEITLNTQYSDEVDKNIRDGIANFINTKEERPGFAASNLITYLENSFPEIDSIVVKEINGSSIQKVERLIGIGDSIKHSIKYTPEYMNVTPESLNLIYKEI